ncbi:hypothetical protein BCV72DRAFT_338369 [Rhizopus microsporus var. microsporus]|uniref:Uncharacterized protein n=1 Tax=Rhizopus microsporus var. microsporus TaxID=86635 RepID=A0A1X0QT26_RHIZD|nr:hypothetical protein BCV72DRAFT_338369 [Rhizopus microsporus var. microsporus]
MIQQLSTSVNYGFNDMRNNFEVMLQENKSLKEEVALLKQQATVLAEEVGTLKASLDSMPSAEGPIEIAATTGLFAANLFPGRNIPEPRARDTRPGRKDRPASFSWKLFRRLIDDVRGPEHDKTDDDMFDACKVNASSALVKAVIDGIQRKFAIKEGSIWRSVAGDARLDAIQELEAKASPCIPLRACVGFLGDNAAEAVQNSSNESRMVISEAMSSSVVDEEFTFVFDASTKLTVDGPQRHLLGKRLSDKGKSTAFRK